MDESIYVAQEELAEKIEDIWRYYTQENPEN